MNAVIAACAGFLLGILWMDLMFDVQTVRDRHDDRERVVSSIATYYRRVTTDASPMGRLIAVVMGAALVSVAIQAAVGGTPAWVSIWSGAAVLAAVGLAVTRTVPAAVRLGARTQAFEEQHAATSAIYRQHRVCAALMVSVLVVQLIWA